MIYLKRFLMTVGALALLSPFVIYIIVDQFGRHTTLPELSDHPQALWHGDPEGAWGEFIEVVKSEHPHYFIEVRGKNGDILKSGWIKYGETNSDPSNESNSFTIVDVLSFSFSDGGYLTVTKTKKLAESKDEAKN